MKIRLEYCKEDENEIVIRCKGVDDEVLSIMTLLNIRNRTLTGYFENEIHILSPTHIYYIEAVNGTIFAYTTNNIYRIAMSLIDIETIYLEFGYFRCSKSMIINMNMIASVQSELGNRIIATLKNHEKIIISRHYVKAFREFLKN